VKQGIHGFERGTDPGAALTTWVTYLHRLAGRIRRRQKLRAKHWQLRHAEAKRIGRPLPLTPDLSRGMGARLTPALARRGAWVSVIRRTYDNFQTCPATA